MCACWVVRRVQGYWEGWLGVATVLGWGGGPVLGWGGGVGVLAEAEFLQRALCACLLVPFHDSLNPASRPAVAPPPSPRSTPKSADCRPPVLLLLSCRCRWWCCLMRPSPLTALRQLTSRLTGASTSHMWSRPSATCWGRGRRCVRVLGGRGPRGYGGGPAGESLRVSAARTHTTATVSGTSRYMLT